MLSAVKIKVIGEGNKKCEARNFKKFLRNIVVSKTKVKFKCHLQQHNHSPSLSPPPPTRRTQHLPHVQSLKNLAECLRAWRIN